MDLDRIQSMQTPDWSRLSIAGTELLEARIECHHAVQINTRLTRGLLPATDDDSHTSLAWDPLANALTGQAIATLRLGLRIRDLTLLLLRPASEEIASFPLDGHTFAEALGWLSEHLRASGLEPDPLSLPIHFKLDEHPLLHGARFRVSGRELLFEELAKWYSNAALCLNAVSSPVRCWPHHFDIATQIGSGDRSTGVGMSPGDGSYSQPYFYVSPWPYPDVSTLPPLVLGHWHTEGWVGAVLTAEEILPKTDQRISVESFMQRAIAKG